MLPLLVCLSKKFPFSSVIASRRAAPFTSHCEERSAVAIRIPITRVRPCCPVSGGLKPSPTFRFVRGGALDAPYRTTVTRTGLRILRRAALAQNDRMNGESPQVSTVIARRKAPWQSVSPGIVTPSVGEGLDPPDTGAQCRTG